MKHLFTLFAALLCSAAVWAHDAVIGGIYYNFNKTAKTAEVTFRGDSYTLYPDRYQGAITIPATVTYQGEQYAVTSLGVQSLDGCTELTSVTLSEGITLINSSAFWGCSKLASLNLPESLVEIRVASLQGTALSAVHIPKNVKSIASYVFTNCPNLTSLTVDPENEWFIAEDNILYSKDKKILYGNIPPLSGTVEIPEGVEEIKGGTLTDLPDLQKIVLPKSLKIIGDDVFIGCPNFVEIEVDAENPYLFIDGTVLYNKDKTEVILCAKGATGEITLEETVKTINHSAFRNCEKITSVVIGDALEKVEAQAFRGCKALASISLPSSVTKIEERTFEGCTALTSFDMPGVTEIGEGAFYNNKSLVNIEIPASVTKLCYRSFAYCENLEKVVLSDNLEIMEDEVFFGCNKLTDIQFSESSSFLYENRIIYTKDHKTLFLCLDRNITSITLHENTTGLSDRAFSGCSKLATVTFNEKLLKIGNSVFSGCSALTSLEFPASLTSIGTYAFQNCTKLATLKIPESTSIIGAKALDGCQSLSTLIMGENGSYLFVDFGKAAGQEEGKNGILYDKEQTTLIRCLVGAMGEIEIPASVNFIEKTAFFGCDDVTSISIPAGVTSIGTDAFRGCKKLVSLTVDEGNTKYAAVDNVLYNKEMTNLICCAGGKTGGLVIPESVTKITNDAFSGCVSVGSVTLPTNYTVVDASAFNEAYGLTEVVFSPNTSKIGKYAFAYCVELAALTLPETLTQIENNAFDGCTKISKIDCLGATPPSCGGGCFAAAAYNNAVVSVPCDAEAAYKANETWKSFKSLAETSFPFAFSVVSENETYGSVQITQSPDCESNIAEFKAEANDGYVFLKWSDDVTDISRIVEITDDIEFIAYFEVKPEEQTGGGTGTQSVEADETISVKGNTICCSADMVINNILGQDVTAQNGNLPAGVYIVRCGEQTTKVRVM